MASTTRGNNTYHPVPRFDMAADNGPLFLGAIFTDLGLGRAALNRSSRIKIREELKYAPVPQSGFCETCSKVREGKFEAWVKAFSEYARGSAAISGSSDAENTITCDEVLTTYFDPDDNFLDATFAIPQVQLVLEGSSKWTSVFYMITGLKVAKGLEYNKSNTSQAEVEGQLGVQEPRTGTGAALSGNIRREKNRSLEFSVSDIVVGYRVNKYRCVRRLNLFNKERKFIDDGLVRGEMMDDMEDDAPQPHVSFEYLRLSDEEIA
ncbi:major facilitator superfamily mfs-1 [Fusarium subglutinans]|uniref:Major facilitator superfamily mfs-1 n=1 Tax=Gibberella subglutinans TaxID=42677 RepID=A0A8H5PC73_GIBSU|nr:major facilitator superfamily mfs-1 [Fusarium subglutinans]KAF5593783.1 major facilitator superfamily mfs-1 [Fusarium subglutinans]